MEENPYLAQIAENSGLPKEAVDSENPYIKQAQINAGKPLEYKTAPDKFMSGLEQASSTINVTNRYSDALANYAKYDVGYNPFGEDWNEIRANNQGVGEKLGRGVLKMGTTMSGAIAENTIGIFSGLASMATGGTYADNAVGRSVDEMNEWMAENFPHYYSQKEQDPDRSAFEALGTANFWTDKFANGLGYSLGSLATVWLTGGTGVIGRGVGLVGKGMATLGEAAAVGKVASTGEKLKKIYEASKMIKTGAKLSDDVAGAAKTARALNAAKHLEVGAMMSLAESSVEAREKSKEFIRESFAAWEEANPGKSAQQDMTAEEKQAILESARAVENTTFGLNMAVLMPTNLFTFGSMIGGSKKLAGLPIGEKMTEDIIEKGGKYVLKTPNSAFGKTLAKVDKFASPIYKNSLNEAFQEGTQYAIGVGASEYFKNKFDTGSGDFAEALTKGLSETFGSADGLESMLLGALTGGVMGTASTTFGAEAAKRKNLVANTERLLNIKNSAAFTDILANAEQNDESLRTISAITAANAVGNYKLANELRKQLIATRAAKLQALDAEELGLEEFDDLEKMSEEEFMKRTGYDTTKTEDGKLKATFAEQSGGKSHVQAIQDLKEEYKKASKLNRDLDDIIQRVNPIKTGLPGMLQGKEQKQADATQRLYNQRLKAILMQHMVSIDTRDEEINASIDELRRLSPEGPDSFATINKDDILALVKKNKITVSETGEIQFPKSVVSTTLSDTASEEAKAKAKAEEQSPEGQRKKKDEDEENKILSKLERSMKYADNLNPIDKMKFINELQNLFTGLQMREESIAAFDELMLSPEKRDLAILAKQGAKAQAKIINDNKEANVVIDEARSTADLDSLINNDTLSPELRERLLKRYKELQEIEDRYVEDYNDLPDAVLKDMLDGIEELKDQDPQKAIAILRVVADRTGETKAQKEARANNPKTDREKKAEQDAAAAVAGFKTSDGNTPNAKQYVNAIRVTTSDNRNIIINGVPYRNNNINIMDAIRTDETAINDEGISPVVSVTLINKDGQTVIFTVEKDPILAKELAEIIMMGYISEGTADTVNMTLEQTEIKVKDILKVLKVEEPRLNQKIAIDEITGTPAVYEYAIKEVQKFLDGLFKAKQLLEEAYKRNNQPYTAVQNDEIYKDIVSLIETYNKKREELDRTRREMIGMPSEGDPSAMATDIDPQDAVEIANEIGRLEKEADDLKYSIIKSERQIEAYKKLQDPTRLVMNAPSPEEVERLIDKEENKLKELSTRLELVNAQIAKLQEQITAQNEARESSEAGQNLQNAEGTEEFATEQGNRPETEGDVEVPTSEELDINEEDEDYVDPTDLESLYSDEVDDIDEVDDVTIQVDFETEEEAPTEDIIDEDSLTIEPVKESIDEEVEAGSEHGGEIDARLIKTQHKTTDDFNHIIVDSDGTPLPNTDYYDLKTDTGTKQKDLNGEFIKISPELLASHIESNIGTEVVFQVIPDTVYWQGIKDSIPANKHWEKVPIFVGIRTPDGRIRRGGMLEGYAPGKPESNISREEIYNNYLQGKRTTSTIAGKRFNSQNIANAVDKNGDRFFYSPFAQGTPTIAIAKIESDSGAGKWEIGLQGDNIQPGDTFPDIKAYPEDLGKVAMIVKSPLGGFRHLRLTTKNMTKAGVNSAKLALMNGQSDILQDLVGFNLIAELAIGLERTDMMFWLPVGQENSETRENTYAFYLPEAESYIRISASNLSLALKGKQFDYGFVKAEKGEKGGITFVKNETKDGQWNTYAGKVIKAFEGALMDKKYQVSIKRLIANEPFESPFMNEENGERKKYANYLEYLKDPRAIPDMDSDSNSWTGIIGSDMYLNEEGSPYFDIGITYGPMLVNGKPVNSAEEDISNKSAKASTTSQEKEESDEYSDEDDDYNDISDFDQEIEDNNEVAEAIGQTEEEEAETEGSTTNLEDLLKSQGKLGQEDEIVEDIEETDIPEEDRDLLDPLVGKLLDIKEKEYKGMFEDPITKEETHYKIQPEGTSNPKKFKRITSFSSEPFNGTEEQKVSSSRAGNTVHDIVEKVLMGDNTYTRGDKMSRVAFLDLKSQISNIRRLIDSRKQKVISTEMIVYSESYTDFAGKFDILARDKKTGKYYLYDVKTGSEAGLANYEKGYTDPQTKKVSKSKRDQHGTQLSMYAYALRGIGMDKNVKVEITGASVLYIPVRYDKTGHIDRVSSMAEKKFTLNYDIKKLVKGDVSFEQKKATTSSDPGINNAGKKKASTKATTKNETPKGKETKAEPIKKSTDSGFVKGETLDAGLKMAIANDAIDAEGIVSLYKGQGKTITLEEAQELMDKVIKENC
jgi:hypothetical protein